MGVLAGRAECRSRCGWFVLVDGASLNPRPSPPTKFGGCRCSVLSNNGSLLMKQPKAPPVGWQNPIRCAPQSPFKLQSLATRFGARIELMAQRLKAPRAASGMAFHDAVSQTVFGACQWAHAWSSDQPLVRLQVRQGCPRFGEGEWVREDNARICSSPCTNLK
jgi:hypothetical protein